MSQRLFRPLVAALSVALIVVSGAMSFADGALAPLTAKQRRQVQRIADREARGLISTIRQDAKAVRRELRAIRKQVQKGRLSGEELDARLQEVCERLELVRESEVLPDFEEENLSEDSRFGFRTIQFATQVVLAKRGDRDPDTAQIGFAIPRGTFDRVLEAIEAARRELARDLDAEKALIDEARSEQNRPPESFVFHRPAESHFVRAPGEEDPLAFVRPGLQRVEVTEFGDATIELSTAFDEPDSFVLIDLKRPDGTVLTRFTARQRDSENGDSRRLKFSFPLDALPLPGEAVLFTASSSFDESLLPLVDPFDCLAFLFPGTLSPVPTSPTASKSNDSGE